MDTVNCQDVVLVKDDQIALMHPMSPCLVQRIVHDAIDPESHKCIVRLIGRLVLLHPYDHAAAANVAVDVSAACCSATCRPRI